MTTIWANSLHELSSKISLRACWVRIIFKHLFERNVWGSSILLMPHKIKKYEPGQKILILTRDRKSNGSSKSKRQKRKETGPKKPNFILKEHRIVVRATEPKRFPDWGCRRTLSPQPPTYFLCILLYFNIFAANSRRNTTKTAPEECFGVVWLLLTSSTQRQEHK